MPLLPRKGTLERQEAIDFLCLNSPWMIGMVIFFIGPLIASVVLSFCDYNIFWSPRWVGLANYTEALGGDDLVAKSLRNTFLYTIVAVPLGVLGSLALAMLLNHKVRGVGVWRSLLFLPSVLTGVAVAILWKWLLNPEYGVVNFLVGRLGVPPDWQPGWLLSEFWAKPALVLMSLWAVGGGMIILLAALQQIPQQLYEAAEIDGAAAWSKFVHVTLPMLSPALFFLLTMGFIGSFQIFTQVYVMTGGGPAFATLFYVLYLFQQAFEFFRMGYASALAWMLFVIILTVTIVQFWLAKRWVYYESADIGKR